jgi:hypothetical protein
MGAKRNVCRILMEKKERPLERPSNGKVFPSTGLGGP